MLPNHEQARPSKPRSPTSEATPSSLPIIDLIFVCRPDLNPTSLVAHLPSMAAAANGVRQALQGTKRKGGEEAMEVDSAAATIALLGASESRPEGSPVYLIPLDVGAEQAIAHTLALRRVAAIGVSVSSARLPLLSALDFETYAKCSCVYYQTQAPSVARLLSLVQEHISPLQAPWLVPHLTSHKDPHPASTHTLIPTHIKHLRTTAPVDPKAALAAKKLAKQQAKDAKRRKPEEVYMAED